MSIPSLPGADAIAARVAADQALIARGVLQRACTCFFLPGAAPTAAMLAAGDAPGVVLALHGWSAGPWQYAELAPLLAARGCHVYAARWPGHGGRGPDGVEDPSELPKSTASQAYADYALQAFADAHALAEAQALPLYVMGLSMGGAGAVQLGTHHADTIRRLVLVAPFLRPHSLAARRLFGMLRRLRLSRITDRLPMSWGRRPVAPASGWVRPGHWEFWLGNLYALLSYVDALAPLPRGLPMPTQFIFSGLDRTSDETAARALFWASKASGAAHWWRFPPEAGVPHAPLTAGENPDDISRQRVFAVILEFLLRGVGANSADAAEPP